MIPTARKSYTWRAMPVTLALFLLPLCSALLLHRPVTTAKALSTSSSLKKQHSVDSFFDMLEDQQHQPTPRSRRRSRRDVSYLNFDLPWPIGAYGAPIEVVVADEKDQPSSSGAYGRSNEQKLSATKATRQKRDVSYLNFDLPWPIGAYGAPVEVVVADDKDTSSASSGVYGRSNSETNFTRQKRDVSYLNFDLPWPIGAYGAPVEVTVEDDKPTGGVYGRSSVPDDKQSSGAQEKGSSKTLTRQKRDADGFFNDYGMPWPDRRTIGFGVPNMFELRPPTRPRNSWSFPFAPRLSNREITRGRSGLGLFAAAGVDPAFQNKRSEGTELFESSFADDVADGSGDSVSTSLSRYSNPLSARTASVDGMYGNTAIAIDPLTGMPASPKQRVKLIEGAVNNYIQATNNDDVVATAPGDDADDDNIVTDEDNEIVVEKPSKSPNNKKKHIPEKTIRTYRYFDDRKDEYKVVPKISRKDLNTYSFQKKRINKHLYNIHRQHIHEHIRNHHLLEIVRHRHPIQQTEVITHIHNRRIPIEYTHNTYTKDAKVIVDVLPPKVQVTRKTLHYKPIYEPTRHIVTVEDQRKNKFHAKSKVAAQRPAASDYVESRIELFPPTRSKQRDGEEEQETATADGLQRRFNSRRQPKQQQFLMPSDFDTSTQQRQFAKYLRRRRAESLREARMLV